MHPTAHPAHHHAPHQAPHNADAAHNFRLEMIGIVQQATGLHLSIATAVAEAIIKVMRARMGGLYIPKREIKDVRDNAIRQDFRGNNLKEVAAKHRVSLSQAYRIVARKPGNPQAFAKSGEMRNGNP